MKASRTLLALLAAVPAMASPAAVASRVEPLSLFGISAGKGGSSVSVPMQIIILLTLMTLLPAAVMCITPFLRITVVLHFLRQALGTQTTPSNQVLLGLALFLTIVIMQPVAAEMYHQGWEPMESGQITAQQAMDQGAQPLRQFLIRFARQNKLTRLEATAAGVESWTDHVKALGVGLLSNEVDSWMTGINRNVEGKTTRIIARYSGSAPAYRARCDEVAANGYSELRLA